MPPCWRAECQIVVSLCCLAVVFAFSDKAIHTSGDKDCCLDVCWVVHLPYTHM